ncbi:peptide maturation system acyl carrier-related protein [Clostridium sporogenes]|uniref:peptide maturation system acyl carrier-related protein n=1 Tax=Clostridium sporogenes TaxID=1509 RepID=UPI002237EDF0|nr:peptide maturation system acyl carrier-related protein [Clostridium sporogenes]MCW6089675.1 peptide maturation system acyl carrier-related protein [Clostridium sporogenes]
MIEIKEALKEIFKNRFQIDFDKMNETAMNKQLLGLEIGMSPNDLVYLLFDIEKEFKINVPKEEIAEGNFCTFNNIFKIISNEI